MRVTVTISMTVCHKDSKSRRFFQRTIMSAAVLNGLLKYVERSESKRSKMNVRNKQIQHVDFC